MQLLYQQNKPIILWTMKVFCGSTKGRNCLRKFNFFNVNPLLFQNNTFGFCVKLLVFWGGGNGNFLDTLRWGFCWTLMLKGFHFGLKQYFFFHLASMFSCSKDIFKQTCHQPVSRWSALQTLEGMNSRPPLGTIEAEPTGGCGEVVGLQNLKSSKQQRSS